MITPPQKPQSKTIWLSVIIPIYNEALQIETMALNWHILNQLPGVELIFVDGGSHDASVELIKEHGFAVITAPRGRAHQMNAGAANASGELLWFIHCDSWPVDMQRAVDRLKNLSNASSPNNPFVWGRFDVVFDSSKFIFKTIALCMNWRSRITGVATGDQGLFISKLLWNHVQGFADLQIMEDVEISKRLKIVTKPQCLFEKMQTSSRRWQSYGVFKTILLMWKLRFAYWRGVPAEKLAQEYK